MKYTLLFFLLFYIVTLTKAFALDKDYMYVSYGIVYGNNMTVNVDSEILDETTGITSYYKYPLGLKKDTFYNSNLLFGARFNNNISVEVDIREYDLFFRKKSGIAAGMREYKELVYEMSTTLVNLRYDFFRTHNFSFFTKIGLGAMQITPVLQTSTGGLPLRPAYLFGVGFSYPMIEYLDLEVLIQTLRNIPKKEQQYTLSYVNSTGYSDLTTNLYMKIKVPYR